MYKIYFLSCKSRFLFIGILLLSQSTAENSIIQEA